jgi:hypothetical protein
MRKLCTHAVFTGAALGASPLHAQAHYNTVRLHSAIG